jgi:hypothetical protein
MAAEPEPEVVEAEIMPDGSRVDPSDHRDERAGSERGSGADAPAQRGGDAGGRAPGKGLITLEEANAEIARANRAAVVYPTRVRYPR